MSIIARPDTPFWIQQEKNTVEIRHRHRTAAPQPATANGRPVVSGPGRVQVLWGQTYGDCSVIVICVIVCVTY